MGCPQEQGGSDSDSSARHSLSSVYSLSVSVWPSSPAPPWPTCTASTVNGGFGPSTKVQGTPGTGGGTVHARLLRLSLVDQPPCRTQDRKGGPRAVYPICDTKQPRCDQRISDSEDRKASFIESRGPAHETSRGCGGFDRANGSARQC